MIERSILSHQGLHPPHSGGELGVDKVEFLIGRELPLLTVRAQAVGPRDGDLAHHCENRFGALPAIPR